MTMDEETTWLDNRQLQFNKVIQTTVGNKMLNGKQAPADNEELDDLPLSFTAEDLLENTSSPNENRNSLSASLLLDHESPEVSKETLFTTYRRRQSVIQKLVDPIIGSKGEEECQRSRLVTKAGDSCITGHNISDKKSKFLVDLFTTLLDLKWRYCILVFAMAFLLSWLGFALIYYIICIIHEDHLHMDDPDWKPCHCNVYDFTTAFLFSLETQHTIGYGFRGMEPNCVPSMIALAAQSCTGAFFQCIVTGLVFAKLSRPKRRSQTIMFSKVAVICQRDDQLYFLFRVGDMRKSHMICTSIRALIVKNRLTSEGELIPLCQYPLQLRTESSTEGESFLFLQWPVTVAHCINKDSPMWDISEKELHSQHFEIIVILEGTVASSSMSTQVKSSYLPTEIIWGHRLAPLLTLKKETGGYKIDFDQFHETIPLENMTSHSAKDFEKYRVRDARSDMSDDNYSNFTTDSDQLTKPSRRRFQSFRKSLQKRRHSEVPWLMSLSQGSSENRAQSPTSLSSPEGDRPIIENSMI